MRRSFPVVLLCPYLALAGAAAPVAVSPVRPLQTELIAPLDLGRVHVGSPVLVRVDLEWTGENCTLRAGSVVQGHVVGLVKRSKGTKGTNGAKGEKDSSVEVAFDAADCEAHHEASFRFTLVALVGGAGGGSSTGQTGVTEAPPLADAVGNSIGGAGGGIRSAQTASAINAGFDFQPRPLPSRILPGQVVGIRRTTLSVGTGAGGATEIRAVGQDVRLEPGTSLILTHEPEQASGAKVGKSAPFPVASAAGEKKGFSMSGTGGGGSEMVATGAGERTVRPAPATIPLAVPEPPDATEICSGACNVVGGAMEVGDSTAAASVSLRRLGYAPREHRELRRFDDETTLTYLDANTLLCTFDPHLLRERAGADGEAVRPVRAVLVDPRTHAVKRVLEWRVRGEEQYLWRLAGGRVMVHMGRELRVLDAQLQPVRSIAVEGKVAWVVVSPTGDHVAVGTVRERHSESVHRDLEAAVEGEPEEDVEVRVYGRDYGLMLTAVQTSRAPAPVLSDAGELRVRGEGHGHWKITEYRWDKTEHTIVVTKSVCRPVLSMPEGGLIFAVGCMASGGRWYRMLRADGHPLLKGESPSDEIEQESQGATGGAFAVRTVKAVRAMSYGQPFQRADLVQQRIAIYRSSDGTSVAAVATADFAPSQMDFALSPAGDQMAVIGSGSIRFYSIRANQH